MTSLILASKSASRAAVLRAAGVPFTARASDVDEDATKDRLLVENATPRRIAETLAEEKALAVSRLGPGLTLGADQTLELAGVLYDKASDLDQARIRLRQFRGCTHHLHAAVVLAQDGAVVWRHTDTTSLTMRDFSDAFLETYLVAHGQAALSSVGCYQLEGAGAQLFTRVDGDYFSILGLPLWGLLDYLRGAGVLSA